MKKLRELTYEELSCEQRLGMCLIAQNWWGGDRVDYIVELIKKHSLGGVWINPQIPDLEETMRKIKEAADYPVLIFTDAESGIGEYKIGKHNAVGCTDSEELAYTFGKVTAIKARKMGYSVVCSPLLDMVDTNWACGGTVRSLGSDKHTVTRLASAIARGMHDGGILTVGKHYPGQVESGREIDAHMAENVSYKTKEELLEYNIYPYVQLNRAGLLDGIMTAHSRCVKIDPDYPASLSKKCNDVIRDEGFDGFSITDGLSMMGIVSKFGKVDPIGMAIRGGNDLALATFDDNRHNYSSMLAGYEKGFITEERLEEAVRRVLKAQHKSLEEPKFTEITADDLEKFERINSDSIFEKIDDGISRLDRNGKYLFVIMTESKLDLEDRGKISVDTFVSTWFNPFDIADKVSSLYPNAKITTISEYPSPNDNHLTLDLARESDGVVFITSFNTSSYVGVECYSSRIISLMKAMQVTDSIKAIAHFGNPFILEDAPHVPHLVIGCCSAKSVSYGLDVLAGDYPAKGKMTYDVKFK